MVRSPTGLDSRERGQLLLVGAITLAILLVGLVIVFNSALFTETVDQESAIQSSNDAVEFMTQTEQDLRSLTIRVGHGQEYSSDAAVNSSVQENVTSYNLVLKEAYADASATYVNVSYHPGDSVNGRRIVQAREGEFTQPTSGDTQWSPVGGPRSDVGWMVFNFNTSELSLNDGFSVRVSNSSAFYEASFRRNSSGHVVVQTNVSENHAANGTVACRPVNGRLLVDVMAGDVYQRSCGFNGTAPSVEPPYQVQFRNGDEASGKYEVVAREEASVDGAIADCSGPSPPSPCQSPVVWAQNVTIVYRSSQVSFRKVATVEVYDGTD